MLQFITTIFQYHLMDDTYQIPSGEVRYSSVLMHPSKPIVFLGTQLGCVEVWKLDTKEILAELRYLIVNDFGEQLPLEDPVVNLAAPESFDLVYAFMGNAAYCIDVELLVIVQKIPISEPVVSGAVSAETGDITVLSSTGYLSQWSPKFIERTGSLDFPFKIDDVYICYGDNDKENIIVFQDYRVLLLSMANDPFTFEYRINQDDLPINFEASDSNKEYKVSIIQGIAVVYHYSSNDKIELSRFEIEENLRSIIKQYTKDEVDKNYIVDFRLERQSRDRYIAEIDHIAGSTHQSVSSGSDSKTLSFALEEYYSGKIDKKSRSGPIIEKLAYRHNIDPHYLLLSYKYPSSRNSIDQARYLELLADARIKTIRLVSVISIILAIILLFLAETQNLRGITGLIFIFPFVILITLLRYWKVINIVPHLPKINELKAMRLFIYISAFYSLILSIIYSYPELLDLIPF